MGESLCICGKEGEALVSDEMDWSVGQSLTLLRGNILVMTLTGMLGMFGRSMAFPYLSLYILALGGEPSQIGVINTLAPLAGLIMFPLGGYLADRAGRVRLIGIAGLLSGAVLLLYMFAGSWQMIALGAFLRGFMVIQFPASSALVADSLAPRDRGRGIAVMSTATGLPAMAAPYVAGAILDSVGIVEGMRYLYAFLAIGYVIAAIANWSFLEETTDDHEELAWKDILRVLKDCYSGIPGLIRHLSPALRALGGVMTLVFLINAAAGSFWVVYAQEEIGLSASLWGLILLVDTVLRNLLMMPAGVLVDQFGRTRCLLASLILSLVTLPLFVVVDGFWPVVAIRAGSALATALFMPACSALMADLVPQNRRGRVMAALGRGTALVGAASGGTGGPGLGYLIVPPLMAMSLISGYLYDWNAWTPWAFLAVALVLAIALTLVFVRDPEKAHA